MRKRISIPPPAQFQSYSPSQLFRFFFKLGKWTEEGFSSEFQTYTKGILISSVTINKWKNHDVIPRRYAGQLFKLIQKTFEPAIASEWMQAFEIVWATHLARAAESSDDSKSEGNRTASSDAICGQHNDWIKALYQENLFSEDFSAQDIYVPLELIETQDGDLLLYSDEDFLTLIGSEKNTDWISIIGPSGSGKSMLALHLAQRLTQTEIMPIYLRGQNISDIEIDTHQVKRPVIDSFSAKSFLKHFRASSKKAACLILDGIDQISGTWEDVIKLLTSLQLEQNVCQAHGKTLSIIIFGRETDLDFIAQEKSVPPGRRFEILGLDGRCRAFKNTDNLSVGEDLRAMWWKKFLAATGRKPDRTLPDFLCTEYADFHEFGSDPLWTFFICQTAFNHNANKKLQPHETVNKYTYTENTNIIYRSIVTYTGSTESLKFRANSEHETYLARLQNLAVEQWQVGRDEVTPYNAEFVHENFSHYLVATRLIDQFINVLNAMSDTDRFDEALEDWAAVSNQGSHNPILADFCQNEASLRSADLPDFKWDAALSLIKNQLNVDHYAGKGLSTVSNILNSASLLFFIWSCFNLGRYNALGAHRTFSDVPIDFGNSTLRQLYQTSYLTFPNDALDDPILGHQTFLTPSLSALHLTAADLSQLSFSLGHMEGFKCETSSFAMTHWSHVKIAKSTFEKSAFTQALYHGCRWQNSDFSSCLFQGSNVHNSSFLDCRLSDIFFSQCHFSDVDFLSSTFKNTIFDRCIFANCGFETVAENSTVNGIEFRHCTFLNMAKSLHAFSRDSLTHCIIQTGAEAEEILKNLF